MKARVSYKINNFIIFREEEIKRLDVIFVYKLLSKTRRLFINITRVLKYSNSTDNIFNILILRYISKRVIIRLLIVATRKLYIISIKRRAYNNKLRLRENDILLYYN